MADPRAPSPQGSLTDAPRRDPFSTPLEAPRPLADSRPASSNLSGGDDDVLAPPSVPYAAPRSPSLSASDVANRDSAYSRSGVSPYSAPLSPDPEKDSRLALGGVAAAGATAAATDRMLPTAELSEKTASGAGRRRRWWIIGALALVVVIIVIVVPVVLTVGKKDGGGKKSSSSSGAGGVSSDNPGSPDGATTGGDGSLVKTEDGQTFTYNNTFGGFWVQDPANPFNSSARPNSWTKPLSEKWDFVNDKIYGVNLGGWLVLEPFITPHFYQKYNGSKDEWTLSVLMANDTANGGLDQIREHYKTFITEKDIAQIAGAGLNWVRLPIPFWAIDTWNDEPYVARDAWQYVVKLFGWCRKYGLRVNLDLHTIPGSQNGYNHSGRQGSINWMYGLMGLANAQRSLDYIRQITEFISQPEYQNVVPMFGIVNEALMGDIGIDQITRFYLKAHNMIRSITGVGEGPWISIHDGFKGTDPWKDFLPGSDRFIMDQHPYFAFGGKIPDPFINGTGAGAGAGWPLKACQAWWSGIVSSQKTFGVTIAGEFSNGWNDCGLFLHGVDDGSSQTYDGDCNEWMEWEKWDAMHKDGLNNFLRASMDTLGNWFFWTWKIGPDVNGNIRTPLWSYQLGLENGWIPKDPREADGTCASYGMTAERFNNTYQPYQTGGGDGQIAASALASVGQWPPPTMSAFPATLAWENAPVYTPTGTLSALPMPTITDAKGRTASLSASGWANTADAMTTQYVPVAGCSYPDPWTIGPTPTPVCAGGETGATLGAALATGSPVGSIVSLPAPTSTAARRR